MLRPQHTPLPVRQGTSVSYVFIAELINYLDSGIGSIPLCERAASSTPSHFSLPAACCRLHSKPGIIPLQLHEGNIRDLANAGHWSLGVFINALEGETGTRLK